MNTFYNTTNLKGEELKEAKTQTLKQDQIILKAFKPNSMNSAWLMFNANVLPQGTPITSYRRACNTLVEKGKIEVIGKRKGNLGKPENTYKLIL